MTNYKHDDQEKVNSHDAQITEIARSLLDDRCRFFIGAGLPSNEASLPGTEELTVAILKDLIKSGSTWVEDLLSKDNKLLVPVPLSVAAELHSDGGKHIKRTLNIVNKMLKSPNLKGRSYEILYSLALMQNQHGKSLLHTIYTTNYDYSIQDALRDLTSRSPITQSTAYADQTTSPVRIFQIHGALNMPIEDWVITEQNELEELTEANRYSKLYVDLLSDLVNKNIVFIGYSMSDISIRFFQFLIRKYSKDDTQYHYVVIPSKFGDKSNPEKSKMARWNLYKEIWAKHEVLFIDQTAEKFFNNLLIKLKSLEQEQLIKDLAEKLSMNVDDINDLVDKYADSFSIDSKRNAIELLSLII